MVSASGHIRSQRCTMAAVAYPYVYTVGRVSLWQFTHNILVANDVEPQHRATLIQCVLEVLHFCWAAVADCECTTKICGDYTGCCCGPVTKALVVVPVLPEAYNCKRLLSLLHSHLNDNCD